MAAILNFRIFAKNGKTQNCLYLLNRARYSHFVEIFNPEGIREVYYWQFSKNFPLPKNGGHFEFSPKMEKHLKGLSTQVRKICLRNIRQMVQQTESLLLCTDYYLLEG